MFSSLHLAEQRLLLGPAQFLDSSRPIALIAMRGTQGLQETQHLTNDYTFQRAKPCMSSKALGVVCRVESVAEGRAAGETEKVGEVRNGETLDRRQTLTKLLVGASKERSPEHRKGRREQWSNWRTSEPRPPSLLPFTYLKKNFPQKLTTCF